MFNLGPELLQFEHVVLTEAMRQVDDLFFANMLTNLVEGIMRDKDWKIFEECRDDHSTDLEWATTFYVNNF